MDTREQSIRSAWVKVISGMMGIIASISVAIIGRNVRARWIRVFIFILCLLGGVVGGYYLVEGTAELCRFGGDECQLGNILIK